MIMNTSIELQSISKTVEKIMRQCNDSIMVRTLRNVIYDRGLCSSPILTKISVVFEFVLITWKQRNLGQLQVSFFLWDQSTFFTAQKFIKDFFSKYGFLQISADFLQIWSHLLKEYFMENVILWAVFDIWFSSICYSSSDNLIDLLPYMSSFHLRVGRS